MRVSAAELDGTSWRLVELGENEAVADDVEITITFAGNIAGRTQTLPLAVYLELESRPDVAVALSLVLLAVSLVVIVGLRERWLGAS